MSLRPLNDRVVVRLLEEPSPSELIVLVGPDLVRRGVVVAVGSGITKINTRDNDSQVTFPTSVRPGEHVFFLAALLDTSQGKRVRDVLDDGTVVLRENDLLWVDDDAEAATKVQVSL